MKLGQFFIERPIFAISMSVIVLIMGLVAMMRLPISQFPEVVPPTVVVVAQYPGADAATIAETVATPIEQEVNGVDGMLYMQSNATNDGEMRLTVTFALGTDIDEALVLVQNRVALAEPRLPEEVRRTGVAVQKDSPDMLLVVQLVSPDGSRDQLFLSNYATQRVEPVLRRLPGVGSINSIGARDYAMRVWLDPERIANLSLTPGEVVDAIRAQNAAVAGGQLAQPPVATDRSYQPAVTLRGRLDEVSEFEDIVVKRGDDGRVVRLSDVSRVELGAQTYTTNARMNGQSIAALLIFQQPGENAIETSEAVKEVMEELSADFPSGVEYRSTYNPTDFFTIESILALEHTIIEAILLVVLVVIVFLQSGRATLIPVAAIPVSLIGTFIVMSALGYSINTLTLFGLVLAVGIVVDDAIVVVENVERYLAKGLSPVEATKRTMAEISGALISIALVLSAVFVPTMLLDGISGEFFRQFAVAIAVATLISAFNSLTLSPALAALLLRHEKTERKQSLPARLGSAAARRFNRGFDRLADRYAALIRRLIAARWVMLPIYGVLVAGAVGLLMTTPRGFVPASDQGYLIVTVQMPAGSALSRTDAAVRDVAEAALEVEGVEFVHEFTGLAPLTNTTSSASGVVFAQLSSFEERGETGRSLDVIQPELEAAMAEIAGAQINVIAPPTIRGIGTGGGFALRVQDYDARGSEDLSAVTGDLLAALNADPRVAFAFSPFTVDAPQVYLDVDHARAEQIGLPVDELSEMLEVYLGSRYVNDINLLGRTYQVRAQAAPEFRLDAEQLASLRTRTAEGQMVPLGAVATVETRTGAERVPRYNLFPTAEIFGQGASISSGEALDLVEEIAAEVLPQGYGIEWTDLSYQERLTEDGTVLFLLAIVFVFLVLASQYESWTLPLAVILIVPTVILSALGGVVWMGMDNNLLTQVALIVLVGLASKNAILIVEFARQLEAEGRSAVDAAVEAARLRLRPILMTSFAFILGTVPLAIAEGAGAELRQAIGIAVFFGMSGVTFFGLIYTPIFYALIRGWVARPKAVPAAA
ncbi:efflux RND transporter permease subunit [Pontivivens ytuae]|uniref:Efflux pump membrane transporter n=1 Tax=Pontivivens ytuae TaxID=2789856 RepID=A0A7S9LVR4_9RHOB|nr:multidrug efflux RND transporter permease subunit [Pontivivens ytuae]QPH56053.1 multidrug efflux RND transporter permease subunit [Pontivivens ytuae]